EPAAQRALVRWKLRVAGHIRALRSRRKRIAVVRLRRHRERRAGLKCAQHANRPATDDLSEPMLGKQALTRPDRQFVHAADPGGMTDVVSTWPIIGGAIIEV